MLKEYYIMKLQKRVNRRVGDKEYLKWYVGIPSEAIEKAGWKESAELDFDIKDGKIILKPKKK
ncbi:AbrB/MazE/SpoVT family DNA-binding domain-containing protein [Candidatus Nitrosotenuis chungbukensis]|uniref:AbrB/MazE/SpoVT family DNA-binding domain-containing protein n=1 Tax=Candidatus Nitrosotenuis chungbukensis TaxID=1353246 RepID=UPI0005B2EAFE|nr:AbrB/MazE/SpoVT family DNA-binding domain-containing protein [Candidatus Nitrosotenuis chungbukensis]